MYLNDTIKAIKEKLSAASCNWCEGEVKFFGVHEIKDDRVEGVIKCLKCERVDPATFKAAK